MDFRGCPISRFNAVTQPRQKCDKFLSIRPSTYRRSASACGQSQDCFRRLKVAPSHCAPLRSNDLCVRLDCGLKFAMKRPMGSSSPPGTWRGWLSQRIAYLFSKRAFHAFRPPAIGDAVVVVDHQQHGCLPTPTIWMSTPYVAYSLHRTRNSPGAKARSTSLTYELALQERYPKILWIASGRQHSRLRPCHRCPPSRRRLS
jgi:hypothetical protein